MKTKTLDEIFREAVTSIQFNKSTAEQFAKTEKKRKEGAEALRITTRKAEIASLIEQAQQNIDALMRGGEGNTEFPNHLNALFVALGHTRRERKFVGCTKEDTEVIMYTITPVWFPTNMEEIPHNKLLLSLASNTEDNQRREKSPCEGKTIQVVLCVGKLGNDYAEAKIDPERSRVIVQILHCNVQHLPTFDVEWSPFDLYESGSLDKSLRTLAHPDTAIRLILEKFGTKDKWPKDSY